MTPIIEIAKWELEEGIDICRKIQPICHENGYHCGLIGGVLNNGESYKDLDIIIHKMGTQQRYDLVKLIEDLSKYFGSVLELITTSKYTDNDRYIYRTNNSIFNPGKQIDFIVVL